MPQYGWLKRQLLAWLQAFDENKDVAAIHQGKANDFNKENIPGSQHKYLKSGHVTIRDVLFSKDDYEEQQDYSSNEYRDTTSESSPVISVESKLANLRWHVLVDDGEYLIDLLLTIDVNLPSSKEKLINKRLYLNQYWFSTSLENIIYCDGKHLKYLNISIPFILKSSHATLIECNPANQTNPNPVIENYINEDMTVLQFLEKLKYIQISEKLEDRVNSSSTDAHTLTIMDCMIPQTQQIILNACKISACVGTNNDDNPESNRASLSVHIADSCMSANYFSQLKLLLSTTFLQHFKHFSGILIDLHPLIEEAIADEAIDIATQQLLDTMVNDNGVKNTYNDGYKLKSPLNTATDTTINMQDDTANQIPLQVTVLPTIHTYDASDSFCGDHLSTVGKTIEEQILDGVPNEQIVADDGCPFHETSRCVASRLFTRVTKPDKNGKQYLLRGRDAYRMIDDLLYNLEHADHKYSD